MILAYKYNVGILSMWADYGNDDDDDDDYTQRGVVWVAVQELVWVALQELFDRGRGI